MHETGVDGLGQQGGFRGVGRGGLPLDGVDPVVVDQRIESEGVPGQRDRGEGGLGGEAGEGGGARAHGRSFE